MKFPVWIPRSNLMICCRYKNVKWSNYNPIINIFTSLYVYISPHLFLFLAVMQGIILYRLQFRIIRKYVKRTICSMNDMFQLVHAAWSVELFFATYLLETFQDYNDYSLLVTHTEKYFQNLANPNQIWIVINISQ